MKSEYLAFRLGAEFGYLRTQQHLAFSRRQNTKGDMTEREIGFQDGREHATRQFSTALERLMQGLEPDRG